MLTRFVAVAFVAVVSLSSPMPQQTPAEEIAALKREVQELREQQAQMQRELTAIKNFLQALIQSRQQGQAAGPEAPGLAGASIPTAGEPSMGSASARVTIMEISDYHCPFCRRQVQQTFPEIQSEYIKTGKVQYLFVDYPIAQLHPTAARAHEAANCAGDQGKYWEMHVNLFNNPPAKDDAALLALATAAGVAPGPFQSCLSSGRHTAAVRASVARMEQLGIGGTPMMVIGLTPAPGQPMKVVKFVYGAQPFAAFKDAIDSLLQ